MDQNGGLLEAEEFVMFVFSIGHDLFECFALMVVISRFIDWTDLHRSLDDLKWLQ